MQFHISSIDSPVIIANQKSMPWIACTTVLMGKRTGLNTNFHSYHMHLSYLRISPESSEIGFFFFPLSFGLKTQLCPKYQTNPNLCIGHN